MSHTSIARRYAKALFELALEQKATTKIVASLHAVADLIDNNDDFRAALFSPLVTKQQKVAVIEQLAKSHKFPELTTQFLNTLIKNGRITIVKQAVEAFEALIRESNGESVVEIRTAKALTKTVLSGLEKTLAKALGAKIMLTSSVDEKLIGGAIVFAGSKMIDASLRGKLNRFKQLSKKQVANL
jgi:F-type H+-transporting ATPase subunit delta